GPNEVALHREAPDGVGPVEDPGLDPLLLARLHHERGGVRIRVVAGADVLHVDEHHIDAVEIALTWTQALGRVSIEAHGGQPREGVVRAVDADHVLRATAQPVLWPEQAHNVETGLDAAVNRVLERPVDRGGVGQPGDATPLETVSVLWLGKDALEPGLDGSFHGGPPAADTPLIRYARAVGKLRATQPPMLRSAR